MINAITQRATLRRTLDHQAQLLTNQLVMLNAGLRLSGIDPEKDETWCEVDHLLRKVHSRVGSLCKVEADIHGQMYMDNRGLTP